MKIGQEWINASVIEIGLDRVSGQSKWYYDQWITTYGIIKNGKRGHTYQGQARACPCTYARSHWEGWTLKCVRYKK